MSQLNLVQEYPKDTDLYDYTYIDLRINDNRFNPLGKMVYQLIEEDSEKSLYNSEPFRGGCYSAAGIAEYNKMQNFAVQNGWQRDGRVYSPLQKEYLPRYCRSKTRENDNPEVVHLMNSLAELHKAGLLTDSEFEKKKQELLGRL